MQLTSLHSAGGPPVGYGLVMQDTDHNGDILGAIYDGMGGTRPNRVPIGCGGLGIDAWGTGAIGTAMAFQLQGFTGAPFLAIGFIGLLVLTYFPPLSLTLPGLLMR